MSTQDVKMRESVSNQQTRISNNAESRSRASYEASADSECMDMFTETRVAVPKPPSVLYFEHEKQARYDFRHEGDLSMNTPEVVAARKALQHHPVVRATILIFWNTFKKDYFRLEDWNIYRSVILPKILAKERPANVVESFREREYVNQVNLR
jgi:hypothetical protein